MGCRGELQRKLEEGSWVADASSDSGEHDGGFRVAGDSGSASECDGGVLSWVFRRGGDQSKDRGRDPYSDSW